MQLALSHTLCYNRAMNTYTCLQCGKSFKASPSDKQKYCSRPCYTIARTGARRKPWITIRCATCGKTFELRPSRTANNRGKYCSVPCKNVKNGGDPHKSGERMITYTCLHCGKLFERPPSRAKYGRAKHCSPECQYTARRDAPKTGSVKRTCANCGQSFFVWKSRIANCKGAGKYCSRKCRDEHRIGPNHPDYIHGNGTNWHGPNWYAKRSKARKRDKYTCQKCGMTESECKATYTQPLHVHHKKPFRLFEGDYKAANLLSNLETLCPFCHRTQEAQIAD